jgi:hypothetical protein
MYDQRRNDQDTRVDVEKACINIMYGPLFLIVCLIRVRTTHCGSGLGPQWAHMRPYGPYGPVCAYMGRIGPQGPIWAHIRP